MQKPIGKEILLSDVIRIAFPLTSTVIGDIELTNRSVNWVVMLTSFEGLSAQLQTGDIVLVPPELQQKTSQAELTEKLEQLASLSIAAVVVFQDVNAKIQTQVGKLGIIMVSVGENRPLREIHKSISAVLIDHQSQISERGLQLYRELSDMSREGVGLDQMTKLMGKLTGRIVVIQDKRLDVIAIDRPPGSIPIEDEKLIPALNNQENLPAVLRNRKAAAKSNKSHWQQLLFPHHNIARLLAPIVSGDRARGYLSIIGPADSLDLLDTVTIEQGAAACALDMAKAKAVSEAKKALRGDFLEGILAGTIPPKEVERLSARLDHNTANPHAIMIFKWQTASNVSLRRIETTLNWLLSTNNQPTLVHLYGEDHVAVFQSLRNGEEISAAQDVARRLRGQLKSDYPDMQLVGGMGSIAHNLNDWPTAHSEAIQAANVGVRLNLDELVEYSSLGVYRLLSQLDNVPSVQSFADQVIGPLIDYDRQHRSNLTETIGEYFNHHGNVSQTAEALFIHRNTLLYRLERIQDLTGHDLNQADMRLALQLALKLWKLRPET